MKSISISLFRRPKYTKILFDALDKCYGIEDYKIIVCCEPNNLEVIALAKKFRPRQTQLIVNAKLLGCTYNIHQCLDLGFRDSDFHIHFEDDTIPSRDCLRYFEWANQKYKKDTDIFTVTGYSKTEELATVDTFNKVSREKWFHPWGWATWKDRYEDIKIVKPARYRMSSRGAGGLSWDRVVNEQKRNGRSQISPVIPRVQNIGAELGVHVPNARFHLENQYNEMWIESNEMYAGDFAEV